jgi:phage gp36-like protein
MAAYASGSDLTVRYDIDLVGDLATDDRATLNRANVPGHPAVAAALLDASGEIDVALQAGGRYTPAQLASLTGNSAYHLKRIACDIAMALLFRRRPSIRPDIAETLLKQSTEHLDRLREGENVFGIPEVIEAGTLELATASTVQVEALNLIPERMSRYFPRTDQRMPRQR